MWDAVTGKCLQQNDFIGRVDSVAWSPDGKQILSGGQRLLLWESGKPRLLGHNSRVHCVAWSPDGKQLLSGSHDETLRLWEVETMKCLFAFSDHRSSINSVAWSPDGKQFLSGSADRKLLMWDATTRKCLRTFEGHRRAVPCGVVPRRQASSLGIK
jgi:WD40 repeat protein